MNTYEELWYNPRFLNKRIEEQKEYLDDLVIRENLSVQRRNELSAAAEFQLQKFITQLTEVLINEPSDGSGTKMENR